MLKVGLIGLGFMGKTHLENYIRLESEGFPVKLEAICDIDEEKFKGKATGGNIDTGSTQVDFSRYRLYTDTDQMLEKEQLDYVDITLPTYLHRNITIKAFKKGFHVFCEKPMALTSADCAAMIDAAKESGKTLMIAQCLRFWPAYEYLKDCVVSGKFGKVVSGYFFRGGGAPVWSWDNWLLNKEKSGGALIDQHVHDVDMINWLFGLPDKVSTIAKVVIPGSGYDIVSTNYIYKDGKVINTQDDWTLNGGYGFQMLYRVNFEKGNVIFEGGSVKVNPDNKESFIPVLSEEMGYYNEIRYYAQALINRTPVNVATPESTMDTIRIVEAELASADRRGELVNV